LAASGKEILMEKMARLMLFGSLAALLLIFGFSGVRAASSGALGQATAAVYLPLAPKGGPPAPEVTPTAQPGAVGIDGYVLDGGEPAAGVTVTLRLYDGVIIVTAGTAVSDAAGHYIFSSPPSLTSDQYYYVRYNNQSDPTRLWNWMTPNLITYSAGQPYTFPTFDIHGIDLVAPPHDSTRAFPITFQWTPRPNAPQDSYTLVVYEVSLSGVNFESSALGRADHYMMNSLPQDNVSGVSFAYNKPYRWHVNVCQATSGCGRGFIDWRVTFAPAAQLSGTNPLLP
jgi:hypothetical protein